LAVADDGAAGRVPVPAADARASAEAQVREVYKVDIDNARSPTAKAELARKLVRQSADVGSRGAERYAMLKVAIDIAIGAADDRTANESIDALADAFAIDAWKLRAETLLALAKRPALVVPKADLAVRFSNMASEAIGAGNFELAHELAAAASLAAKKSKDKDAIRAAATNAREIDEVCAGYQGTAAARKTLASDPAAPASNAQVGRFTCFLLGDWKTGLPSLKLSDDATLRPLAERESKVPLSLDEAVAVADQWWALSDNQTALAKRNIRRHAAVLYTRALPELDGLAKIRIIKRLEEIGRPTVEGPIAKGPPLKDSPINGPPAEAPQFPPEALIFRDDFSKASTPEAGRDGNGVWERGSKDGRYYMKFDSGDHPQLIHGTRPVPWAGGADFAVQVVGRVLGNPGDAWDVMILSQSEAINFAVTLSNSGKLNVAPTAMSFKQEGPRSGQLEPAAMKRGDEFNTALMVAFKQKGWVYINGVLQVGPLPLPEGIFPSKVKVGFKSARGTAEFGEISIWSVQSFPPAEQN
jgi:hypothetical protein